MSSKDDILEKIKQNQPSSISKLPDLGSLGLDTSENIDKYKTVLKSIGGDFVDVKDYDEVINYIKNNYAAEKRKLTTLPELAEIAETNWTNDDPHSLENVELTIVRAHFGVAENLSLIYI